MVPRTEELLSESCLLFCTFIPKSTPQVEKMMSVTKSVNQVQAPAKEGNLTVKYEP